jgi:hypothetical protein
MKDKFNYTARVAFICPCCDHMIGFKNSDYCPNCEVRMTYPTLNRDKVMDDLHIFISQTIGATRGECDYPSIPELADALCSLSLPTLSEGEIDKAWEKHHKMGWPHEYAENGCMNKDDFKAAIKELTKLKEEER